MESDGLPADDQATLEPPGSIAVIGAGPLGIEAALYGRYLGYDVRLIEADGIAASLSEHRDEPIPMMPDRSHSVLARSALEAQQGEFQTQALPLTVGQWMDEVWVPLTQTDLMRGRVEFPRTVVSVDLVDGADDEEFDDEDSVEDDDVPQDFCLTMDDGETSQFEAVILATGASGRPVKKSFAEPFDYWFTLGPGQTGNQESDFLAGLKRIVSIYASLGGRSDLDLYRPLRG